MDGSRVRAFVRHAIGDNTTPITVRVNVFSQRAGSDPSKSVGEPDILVTTSAVPSRSLSPLRVQSTQYERDLPPVKHVGTFGLIYQRRLAQLNGFDDILFLDSLDRISEGST